MKKAMYMLCLFFMAFLLFWGLYTKAHPGYDMILCGQKIGSVKNKTQAEDILTIIRHETNNHDIPVSLYLRFFKLPAQTDAALLLENARKASGLPSEEKETNESVEPLDEPIREVSTPQSTLFSPPLTTAWISSPFGPRDGRTHEGVDLAAEEGTDIFAAAKGTAIYSGDCEGYGKLIILSHDDGYESYYAHCSQLYVSVGDTIEEGDVIAAVGSTGNSTGPHLHFELRKNGVPENPALFWGNVFT